MYRISKSFTFAAAHKLVHPYIGKCSTVHGHTYTVDVVLVGDSLDSCGMLVDFNNFAPLKRYIDIMLDHSLLNDTIEQPTCEHIAKHLFEFCAASWAGVESVRVWESAKAWAEYSDPVLTHDKTARARLQHSKRAQ